MSMVTTAQAVRELREALGMTQAQLAEALGACERSVGYWESGERLASSGHLALMVLLAPTLAIEVRLLASHAARARQEEPGRPLGPAWAAPRRAMSYAELSKDLGQAQRPPGPHGATSRHA